MPAAAIRSRLLSTLEAAIQSAANPVEAQCLRAERAALLARQGQLERARGAIDELNAQLAWQPANSTLRGWVALAEGLHGYYSTLGRDARDVIELAYSLAQNSGPTGTRLRATAAAWLANMSFAHGDPQRMATLIREAIDSAAPEHHGARARAALVAGFAYHFGGRAEVAQRWYEASRRHAIAEGDEAHLSALMHNQAWMRASLARFALLFETDKRDPSSVVQALMGAESIGHYDAGIGTASLGSFVPILRAQVLTTQGRWAEAVPLFEANHEAAMTEGLQRIAPCLLADRAWCALNLGQGEGARALAQAAEEALVEPCDTDDRALALARLAQVREGLGDAALAEQHREESVRLHAAHREQQRLIVALLDEALAGVEPARV